MLTTKVNGRTARQWLIQFAQSRMRYYRISAHVALEEEYAENSRKAEGSLGRFAATAYEGISQRQLELLIKAVEKGI